MHKKIPQNYGNNFEPQNCDLKHVVEESARLSEAYTIGKEIDISCLVKNTAQIYIDENKFIACIVNIIKNGIEAIETKGLINIIAEINNNQASIKISNNGKMIPEAKQNEIFKEGYTTKSTGCGLGLHICKTQLEIQKADLRLNKSTKTLTEFEIIIPTV